MSFAEEHVNETFVTEDPDMGVEQGRLSAQHTSLISTSLILSRILYSRPFAANIARFRMYPLS